MARYNLESDLSRHPLHYFMLICTQLVGVWGLMWFNYHRPMQLVILFSMGLAYVSWGVVHHSQHRDLHPKIVLEYVLWALLAVMLVGFLILRT